MRFKGAGFDALLHAMAGAHTRSAAAWQLGVIVMLQTGGQRKFRARAALPPVSADAKSERVVVAILARAHRHDPDGHCDPHDPDIVRPRRFLHLIITPEPVQQQQQQLYPTKTARAGLDTVKGPLREHTAT